MDQDNYTYENLKNLRYIDMIQTETTRFYGPINMLLLREANSDHILGNTPIKKGTYINIVYSAHYRSEYFKDPYKFVPERW